jgi:Carboxypeptidase regulatory-like domain
MLREKTEASCRLAAHLGASTVLVAILVLPVASFGQVVNATLRGTVTDPSGAAIPGASVTATDVATGVATKTTSGAAGDYVLPSLPPATYSVRFEKTGFKATLMRGIVLQVDQKANLNAQLQLGNVSQRVEVTTEVPLVNTQTATVGTVVDTRNVVELPLNLREYGSLATLVPGAVPDNGGFASSTIGSPFAQTSYNSNGNRSSSNSYLVDGIESRNLSFGGFALEPPPDAVQEFNLETNIYSAAFGLAAGSTINLTTKSGTNQIHGAVYEFLRNSGLDARNFFSLNQTNPYTGATIPDSARPEYRRNQFGFTLGGPIKKDKTFWFVNYEGLRRIEGEEALNTVPTPTELSGNLSQFLTGKTINLCGAGGPGNLNFDSGQLFYPASLSTYTCPSGSANAGKSILVGTPIPGNMISVIDPVAKHALSLNPFPAPNYPTTVVDGPNYIQSQPLTESDNSFIARVDQNFSPKDQVFARYMFGQSNWVDPYSGYSTLPTFGDTLYFRGQNMAVGWTHTISPTLLNEARIGFQRNYDIENCASCPRSPDFMSDFGIQGLAARSASSVGFPVFSFVNFATIGDSEYRPVVSPDMVETYHDDMTWTHGAHTVGFGADMQFFQILGEQAAFSPHGQLAFDGQYSGLNGEVPDAALASDFADFLLGAPSSANDQLRYEDTNQVGGKFWSYYVQDDWKTLPNLTLNLGLRWEYRGFPSDKRDNYVTFVPVKPAFSGPGDALLVTAEPDALNNSYCSQPQYAFLISSSGECLVANSTERAALGFTGSAQQTLVYPYYRDWDPRFGFAWKPLPTSDRFVFRGGFGIFTDLPNFNNQHFVNNNPINGTSELVNNIAGAPLPLTNGQLTSSENILAGNGVPTLPNQFISLYVSPNYKDPTIMEWSFGLQSQLSRNFALETDYIANRGYYEGALNLPGNQPRPTPSTATSYAPYRPYPDFGEFLYTSPNADSIYNSMQVKLTKRFSNGVTFLTSYTWQNAFDDNEGDEGFGGGVGNGNAQNDNCLMCNWGPSYIDAHQRIVFSGIWQLPVGVGQHFLNRGGVTNEILGGWNVSGIYSYTTGFPFTVVSSRDWSNSTSADPTPDRTCNGNNGPQTVADWYNLNCFTTAPLQADLAAGTPTFGNEQRNALVGPPLSDLDFALLKNFKISERFNLQFRGEFYNFFNQASFSAPGGAFGTNTAGVLTSTSNNNREIQFALKLLF